MPATTLKNQQPDKKQHDFKSNIGKLIAESQHTQIQKHIKNEKSKEEQTEKKIPEI